jgi:CheY-like chemotaxis protein
MSPELERLIGQGATVDLIAAAARNNGMMSLFESGLRHVLEGDSSVDELLRVTDIPLEGRFGAPGGKVGLSAVPSLYPTGVFPAIGAAVAAPSAPVAPAVDLTTAFELIEEAPPATLPATERSRGVSVLLVDDEDQLRRVMKDLLERDGYIVHEARDGVQALDQVDRVAPDIIVLDLNLPGLDGYAVLSQLRSRPTTQGIPVVVLTAKGDEDNEVRVFELGADDFLTKPFRARALSARLEAVLGRRRAAE